MATGTRLTRASKRLVAVVSLLAALVLCAFQFGDRYGLNGMPFSQVQRFAADLDRASQMAKQGNIELDTGQAVPGQTVRLRGELADANCYLGTHTHAYDHAFCAKLCVAAGSPLLFVPDQSSQIYLVLSAKNGIKLPEAILDQIGVPGIVVTGKTLEADGLHTLALEGLQR
jgi:hypothetical protein